jgi:hypothetical protein
VTVRGWQRSDKVDMYVGKVGVRYQSGSWLELDIPLDLDPLAEQQVLAISVMVMVLAICGQQNPAVMRHLRRPHLWVVEGVQQLENRLTHLC